MASAYSLAITEAIVAAGEKSDLEIMGELPINIVTAIVSPRARPRPNTTAELIPEIEGERTASLIISYFVEPSAYEASFWWAGISSKIDLQIEEIVGTIMIDKISAAVKIPIPKLGPWKIGRNPKCSFKKGARVVFTNGAR